MIMVDHQQHVAGMGVAEQATADRSARDAAFTAAPAQATQNLALPAESSWMPQQAALVRSLRAVVLLGGSVRQTQLRRAADRFILELPVDQKRTVLDCWRDQVQAMARFYELENLTVRVMIDHATPQAKRTIWDKPVDLRIERDPLEFRGTGGLLRDLVMDYDDDDLVLVGSAAQIMLESLSLVTDALAAGRGDIRILAQDDGTPSGLMLVRCGCLRTIPKLGFVDLNEQALPAIAKAHEVTVVRRSRPIGMPIRTRTGYLDALKEYHRRQRGISAEAGPFAEDWHQTFCVIEEGAQVDPSAVIHDSVVLAGGQVEPDAVSVRSVICPGGRLEAGESVVDTMVVRPSLSFA